MGSESHFILGLRERTAFMNYNILHESNTRIRIHVHTRNGRLNAGETQVLEYALPHIKGVTDVKIYPPTGDIALKYQGDRQLVLDKLSSVNFDNIILFADEINRQISEEELKSRDLTPELKRKMRTKILLEAASDLFLPMPVQMAYHAYQFITLRGLF